MSYFTESSQNFGILSIHDYEKNYIPIEKVLVIILREQNKMWFVKSYDIYIYIPIIICHIYIFYKSYQTVPVLYDDFVK